MNRLNVVCAGGDSELDAIRRTLDEFESASGLDQVLEILSRCCTRGDRTPVIDLIGHGRPQGFLVLGGWTLDDSSQTAASFSELVRPYLELLGVSTIRLLGCSTATTQRAQVAIRRIARAARCSVLGTRRYIGRYDYGRSGFLSDETLVDGDGCSNTFGSSVRRW